MLRRFEDRDAHVAVEMASDEYTTQMGSLPPDCTLEAALEWVVRQRRQHDDGVRFSFVVADARTDVAVGAIGLRATELHQGRLAVGYSTSPQEQGRGVATDALRAVTAFAWTLTEAHRVELYVEPWNTASIRTAERAGYAREGLLRSHQEIGGRRRDMLLYAALRPEDVPQGGPNPPLEA